MLEIEEVIPATEPELLDADDTSDLAALIDNSTALTLVDRTEAGMIALETELRGKQFAVTTTAGDKEARATRMKLVKLRTGLARVLQGEYEKYKTTKAFADALKTRIVALEEPIDAQIKAEEARKAAEKAERDRIERERILAITAKVQAIKELPLSLMLVGSARLTEEIDKLTDTPIEEGEFAEFTAEAGVAKQVTLLKLGAMRADAFEREETARKQKEEAARLKAEREAQEAAEAQRRIEAEAKAKAEREAAEAKAAADKAAADAIADEAARKLAEAQALLAEAKRVQEENERREQNRLQREAEERTQMADTLEAACPPPIAYTEDGGVILAVTVADPIFDIADIETQRILATTEADRTVKVCGMAYPLNDGIPPAPQDDVTEERPSNAEIIKAVADAFDVDAETALGWIFEIAASSEIENGLREAA